MRARYDRVCLESWSGKIGARHTWPTKIHMARFLGMSAHPISIREIASGGTHIVWGIARVPLLAVLVFLAPAVDFVCGGALLFGIFISIAFKVSGAGAAFPFWHMIGASLGFGVFAILYHALIGLLSR
jgi:hypothetical protein